MVFVTWNITPCLYALCKSEVRSPGLLTHHALQLHVLFIDALIISLARLVNDVYTTDYLYGPTTRCGGI